MDHTTKPRRSQRPFALKIKLPGSLVTTTLNAPACVELLRRLDGFGTECSFGCKNLRGTLREALSKAGLLKARGDVRVAMSAHFKIHLEGSEG